MVGDRTYLDAHVDNSINLDDCLNHRSFYFSVEDFCIEEFNKRMDVESIRSYGVVING